MLADELLPELERYLAAPQVRAALGLGDDWRLAFLAQGEYNINYIVETPERKSVVRINTGTQIGKAGGEQIAYEAAALRALDGRGVAPRLLYLDASLSTLPYGMLVMEYFPGGPLQYADPEHVRAAAQTLARLHQSPVPTQHRFIVRRPLLDDLGEAKSWLVSYLACERASKQVQAIFLRLLEQAALHAGRQSAAFPPSLGLVHTDVQAHNFVVDDGAGAQGPGVRGQEDEKIRRQENKKVIGNEQPTTDNGQRTINARLVDWERPLVDDPTYDLAHFLIPTTSQWKCGYTFSPDERDYFLNAYGAARGDTPLAELRERLQIREPFILLRAISWCAGAWVEYTESGRMIANRDTLERIEVYLQPEYLADLFVGWL